MSQNTTLRVACIGNSITYGGLGSQSYPQQLGAMLGDHYEVRNYGISGTTLLKKGDYPYWNEDAFNQVVDWNAHIIIISLGTNDSKPQNWIYKDEFFADYVDFVGVLRAKGTDPQIYVADPPPVFVTGQDINGVIIRNEIIPLLDSVRTATRTFKIDFYNGMLNHGDLFPDGIHPNAAGYTIMAEIAKAAILNGPSGIIRIFAAQSDAVELGQSTMLYWEATIGSTVTLDGLPVGEIDSMSASPSQRTVYTLIAAGEATDTSSVTIEFLPPGKIKSLVADPPILDKGTEQSSSISWSTTNGSTVFFAGEEVAQNGWKTVTPESTTTYTLEARGTENETQQIIVKVLPSEIINRALNHPITASSTARGFSPQWAVDENPDTYWQSAGTNAEWLYVDLGKTYPLQRLVINWGDNYATLFHVQVLDTNNVAKTVYSQAAGNGGVDEITGLSVQARYVRLLCIKTGGTGYSVKEFAVYTPPREPSAVSGIAEQPGEFLLAQNYPNPFNASTKIEYAISEPGKVVLAIYNVTGRQVQTLTDSFRSPGHYTVKFEAGNLGSGLYLYQLTAGKHRLQKGMIVLK